RSVLENHIAFFGRYAIGLQDCAGPKSPIRRSACAGPVESCTMLMPTTKVCSRCFDRNSNLPQSLMAVSLRGPNNQPGGRHEDKRKRFWGYRAAQQHRRDQQFEP